VSTSYSSSSEAVSGALVHDSDIPF
jgi:hypothetical protein